MNPKAKELFEERLDVRKNLGLDYYQFETHVRSFVLELIEPTVSKAAEDHRVVAELQCGYEALRQQMETLVFETQKIAKKTVSQTEFFTRTAELERSVQRSGETINTDFKRVSQQFEVVKEKVGIMQTDLAQFNKLQGYVQHEVDKLYQFIEKEKQGLLEGELKRAGEAAEDSLELKQRIKRLEDEVKAVRHGAEQHTQFIREFEIKQRIFETHQLELLRQEAAQMEDGLKLGLKDFDLKLMKAKIETSDEVQELLKNSREELLRAFRREYNAKRVAKATQAAAAEDFSQARLAGQVLELEIIPPVNIRVLEYDKERAAARCRSGRRPRRDAVPRANTPPAQRRTEYRLLPGRVCLTESELSEESPSAAAERREDHEMQERIRAKREEEERLRREEEAERQRLHRLAEEEEARKRNEAKMSLNEMSVHAEQYGKEELISMEKEMIEVQEDPEVVFLREEEKQLQDFYATLFPPELLKQGVPDFSRFLQLIREEQWKPNDLLGLKFEATSRLSDLNQSQRAQNHLQPPPSFAADMYQSFSNFEAPSIHDYNPVKPIESVGPRPTTPVQDTQQNEAMKEQNYQSVFEYFGDALLQLRDELTIRMNEQLGQIELRQAQELAKVAERRGGKVEVQVQQPVPQPRQTIKATSMQSRMSSLGNPGGSSQLTAGGVGGVGVQTSIQSSNMPRHHDSSLDMPNQAAVEQSAFDRARLEFQGDLTTHLRRAQARVIAHCRMENRNLLKLWSLRIRKEMVSWLASAQQDFARNLEFLKTVDDRGRRCESQQFDILDVLQRQMRGLETKFEDLREQQQKILFGGDDEGGVGSSMGEVEDDETEVLSEIKSPKQAKEKIVHFEEDTFHKEPSGGAFQNNQDPGLQPTVQAMSFLSYISKADNSQKVTPPSPIMIPILSEGNISSSSQGQSNTKGIETNSSVRKSPQIHIETVPNEVQKLHKPTGGLSLVLSPTQQDSVSNLSVGGAVVMSQASSKETLGLQKAEPQTQKMAEQVKPKLAEAQIADKPNHQDDTVRSNQFEAARPSPLSTSRQTGQTQQNSNTQQSPLGLRPDSKPSQAPAQNQPNSPFRRQAPAGSTNTNRGTPGTGSSGLSTFKRAGVTVKGLNMIAGRQDDFSKAAPGGESIDKEARELISKQKKKVQLLEMKLMSVQSTLKSIEINQKELEEYKIRKIVNDNFEEQMQKLNLDQLRADFAAFQERMSQMEAAMTHKMKEVDIMYAEVEAGFTRNARDRSDYLQHHEQMVQTADVQVSSFKHILNSYRDQIDRLSSCILSIVNEEEASKFRQALTPLEGVAHPSPRDQIQGNVYDNTSPRGDSEVKNQNYQQQKTPREVLLSTTGIGVGGEEYEAPRRNGDSGRFGSITELANEIQVQTAKNKTNMQFFFDRKEIEKTTLPAINSNSNRTQLNMTSARKASQADSKFNYTEFLDQALITSLNNATLDPRDPPQYQNPLLRASINGVVSHRIKNLLGTNPNGYAGSSNQQIVYSNYSQKVFGGGNETNKAAQEPLGGGKSLLQLTGAMRGGKQLHSSLPREAGSYLDSQSMNSSATAFILAKNDLNFDTAKALSTQRKGAAQNDYLKLHKQALLSQYGGGGSKLSNHHAASTITVGEFSTSSGFMKKAGVGGVGAHLNEASTPIMLQALVGSRDTLAAQRQRRKHSNEEEDYSQAGLKSKLKLKTPLPDLTMLK